MGENKIYIQTDEEFNRSIMKDKKDSVLDSLLEASKTNKRFTTKDVKKQEKEPPKSKMSADELSMSMIDIPEREDFTISDEKWDTMMDFFEEVSPIEDIANEGRFSYRSSKQESDEYQAMFKKEKSMLSDVLSDLQKRSKLINKRIENLSGKGPAGVSKNYVELVEASVSLDSTKLNVIKEMVNIKKTAADLRMKDKKLNPEVEGDDRDSVADAFYKQIMGGNNKDFLQNTVGQYAGLQGGIIGTRSDGTSFGQTNVQTDDEYKDDIGFNITRPIPSNDTYTEDYDELGVDNYGYIANENRNVDICVYRYEDGTLKFAAIDEEGIRVDNYELPSAALLDDMRIKPMSSFAYDRFDRKYRIIDQKAEGVDLSDLDDDRYDSLTNDDKYDID